jgi:AraC-like DNA-binding protein
LLHEPAGEVAMATGSRFEVDDERWSGSVERLVVSPGLHVLLNDLRPHRDFGVKPVDTPIADPLVGQVMLDGQVGLDFGDGSRVVVAASHMMLYRSPGAPPTYRLSGGSRFRSVAYQADPGRIVRSLGIDLPTALRHASARTNRRMLAIAERMFSTDLNGPLRRMMLEGTSLHLLALQAAAASRPAPARPVAVLSPREREVVHEARRRLLADMRDPPTLGEVAQAVGLAERRLGAAFRLEFGAGPFEVLRDHRLDHARQALEQGAASLKDVARRVGYNHVSNFVHAFRARYGAPPRQFVDSQQ